ncbi:2-succinyl-5-enolpyruvyl-6-hydroxy-3-cyclohexene-1-carboxylic-acid synthase [Sulfurivermis fontis]|uniref:2-succinyl-5-enolpyruvyl-6-hydroxy-3- cyclohexene-1-carboxylic-acid synthase n=1 Tax=Sulfurivermis fontis TaxID=1972068 RepID=UPI000FDA1622|nr:2-succinyl-5-enolpyruvyl-6-hydroxy-3-cyclohexene-1-carboxylic-acid synthase [Sulfurivermis fontis]
MSDIALRNYRWAWALLDGLAAAGVRRAVVSPGSRSTPLTLAALRHPHLTVQVCVDERAAGFFALGLARAEAAPVVLIATSGSAVANWLPAVVEADMGCVPLVLLSADRPPELHDCGANQTMDQNGLFGRHVRAFHPLPPAEDDSLWLAPFAARAVAQTCGPLPGPVHCNVPLREPLVPDPVPLLDATARVPQALRAVLHPAEETLTALQQIIACGPGAIVCGPQDLGAPARAAIIDCAQRLNVPVFADVLSGLRCGTNAAQVLHHPDSVARGAPAPAWLLRLGGAPVSRAVNDWLARCTQAAQVVVSAQPRLADPVATATHVLQADPGALCRALHGNPATESWLQRFSAADAVARKAAAAACSGEQPFEGAVLRALLHDLPARTPLFLGNSLSVRAADWFAGVTAAPLRLFGNRGVSGIDGNIATACGIAAALGPTVAVVGDLAFLHDLNALALGQYCPLTVVLLDNGGGGIFDHLPQATLAEYEQGWLTPQALDPARAAQAFGLGYTRADCVAALPAALRSAMQSPHLHIVHVPIERAYSLARIRSFHTQARSLPA